MKILIIYNSEIDAISIAKKASEILNKGNVTADLLDFSDIMKCKTMYENIISLSDVIVAIGGDGTIIKVAKIAATHNKPILGINAGHLGYLASVSPDNLEALNRLTSNDYTIENRAIIKAEKYKNDDLVDSCLCLNDAVISKQFMTNIVDVAVTIGNDTIKYHADGIIAATPTGSTAYSMSAGGPVIDPTLDCIVITPVCPHTLLNRSLVINANTPVVLSVTSKRANKIILACDGQLAFEIDEDTFVKISVSDLKAKFIKLNDSSVYKIFFDKTNRC